MQVCWNQIHLIHCEVQMEILWLESFQYSLVQESYQNPEVVHKCHPAPYRNKIIFLKKDEIKIFDRLQIQ